MVQIGDRIKLENGKVCPVLGIEENFDGRYVIVCAYRFIEGDEDFEVVD